MVFLKGTIIVLNASFSDISPRGHEFHNLQHKKKKMKKEKKSVRLLLLHLCQLSLSCSSPVA